MCIRDSSLQKPLRCQNGFCGGSECETESFFLESEGRCPVGLQRCEDGTCRSQCLPYFGCPMDAPFMCQDGLCKRDARGCEQGSLCPPEAPYRCRNSRCVSSPLDCPQSVPLYEERAIQMQVSVDTLTSSEFVLSYSSHDLSPVVSLELLSGSLTVIS